jgi:Flp pilus assembly protein TadG
VTTDAPCDDLHVGPRISAIAADTVITKIAASVRAFWGDTDGVILPYVTMMLVVIVGVSVLALDGSRYMSLQTQLQNGADALALAGAAELDRTPTAIERATHAINRLCLAADPIKTCGSRVSNSCARCRHATVTQFCQGIGRAIRR